MILSEHLVRCDTDGVDFNTHWYRWTIGRLQQVFLAVSYLNVIHSLLSCFLFLLIKLEQKYVKSICFSQHHEQVQKYSSTLETLLFTPDLDPHILDVFHQFVSLRA